VAFGERNRLRERNFIIQQRHKLNSLLSHNIQPPIKITLMAQLPFYKNFGEKDINFKSSTDPQRYRIENIDSFNSWYGDYVAHYNNGSTKFNYFFRGMPEARYKLYTSAQRLWITNQMKEWMKSFNYLQFVQSLVNKTKDQPLIKKVFDFYGLKDSEVDFPVLSILQHYGAPTPLMDWSYNIDVALYFATENVLWPEKASDDIDEYFSVYVINKTKQDNQLQSIFQYVDNSFPDILRFQENDSDPLSNFVVYISDFERNPAPAQYALTDEAAPSVKESNSRPITVYFNQNILPQEGLFIFSPYSEKTLEECFNAGGEASFELDPFMCFNIKKDLAEYIRRKIASNKITSDFIYPKLNEFIKVQKESTINDLFKNP
jgi:FRG domain